MTFSTTKDPRADLDYQIDWTQWLGSDTIVTSTWSVPVSSGLTIHAQSIDGSSKKTSMWLLGGNLGSGPYAAVNTVITAAGRKDDRSILVTVQSR